MTISIITATYQSFQTLKDTIQSVLNQSYRDIEYIIIDGGSTDETVDLLMQEGNRIKWVSERDSGIYNALNKGISMATGDYIGFLHADDVLAHNDVIEDLAKAIFKQQPDVLYGDLEYVLKNDLNKILRYWKSKPFNIDLLNKGWMPPHPTVYVKKDWYSKIGAFNESFRIAADYDFLLRLFSQPQVKTCYINEVLVKMRVGGESNKSVSNILQKMREDYLALKNNNIGGIPTLILKNISKFNQFTSRK